MTASTLLAVVATQPSSLDMKPQETMSDASSSPRQYPTDLSNAIMEEGDETDSEPPNEPVTPVSGRQSQDFHQIQNHDAASEMQQEPLPPKPLRTAFNHSNPASRPPVLFSTPATPSSSEAVDEPAKSSTPLNQEPESAGVSVSRRSTRGSSSGFKRTMSNIFRRSNSQHEKDGVFLGVSDTNLHDLSQGKTPARRWSMNRSSNTTRSNTPPSPGSPLEIVPKSKEQASTPTVPVSDEFFNQKKKNRASTGFGLRSRAVNFVSGSQGRPRSPIRRRASSVDFSKQGSPEPVDPNDPIHIDRSFWGLPAEAGTGVKARRMSLSLPDDFTVDVVELQSEFEHVHKFLGGRRAKQIGKGATSKVTLMVRKGCPSELYAVKEFRGKSSRETNEEYEKKVKSEYTLAKSLHHPNIVETIRLCTDRGRWDHVMEYCSEGDLFTLVNKKYLHKDDREKDRLCLFKQLVQGVNYLHSNGIAHRDIKLENLLITEDSKLKITDFGVSEVFSGIHPGLREAGGQCGRNMGEIRLCSPGICGSEPYIAPEVLSKAGEYDPRALDVWSSAIVMIHLIFGGAMWLRAEATPNNKNYVDLVKGWEKWNAKHGNSEASITEQDYPNVVAFDRHVKPPALRRILLQMLNPDPARRISIAEVINNRWMKNVECCQLESYDDPSKMIDASKKHSLNRGSQRKIFCHNHLPPKESNTHSLGKMPGSSGY
ncbi:hypothetical protein VTK73DRAFT_5348 [Phialemonium thermophilum]|uniref:Protein kinase domain-containing protein n=1 Tax=Phialemonium thermophilum TaxID=223376 RepID=A0ABR3Y8N0_9PEZI